MRVFLATILALLVTVVSGQGANLILTEVVGGTFQTRVFCEERVNCSGTGTDVFWSFFGLVTPIPNSENRFTESMTLLDVEGESLILSSLVLSPAQTTHQTLYQCQVQGNNPFSASLNVVVDPDPLEIISEISNIDISTKVIGSSNVTVVCQVETCLSDVTIQLFKGNSIMETETISDNTMDSVNVVFTIDIEADTAGQYSCQALAPGVQSSNKAFFNITGVPIAPSTSISIAPTPMSSSQSTPVVTTNVAGGSSSSIPSVSVSSTSPGSASTASVSSSPSMLPSSTTAGGGSATVVAQWTLLLSLLLMTIMASLLV